MYIKYELPFNDSIHLCLVAIELATESTLLFMQIDEAVYRPIVLPTLSNCKLSGNLELILSKHFFTSPYPRLNSVNVFSPLAVRKVQLNQYHYIFEDTSSCTE